MADEKVEKVEDKAGEGGAAAAGKVEAGAGGGGAQAGKAAAGEGGKAAAGEAGKAAAGAKTKDEDASSEPSTDDAGMIKAMPKKKFMERLVRMTNKELRSMFGTTDVDKILEERKELETLRKEKAESTEKADEERRAKMAEEERLKEDKQKLEKERDELRAALAEKDEEHLADKQGDYLKELASQGLTSKGTKYALMEFKQYIRSLSNRKVEKMTEKDVTGWFADYAKENPEFAIKTETAEEKTAREAAEKKEADAKKAKVKVDTSPKKAGQPVVKSGAAPDKKPMDMTKAEFAVYKTQRGLSF